MSQEKKSKLCSGDADPVKTAHDAVFVESKPIENAEIVNGYDFNAGIHYDKLLESFYTTGFQATCFGQCVRTINSMISQRKEAVDGTSTQLEFDLPNGPRPKTGCTIFLGFTSNLVSSGLRETIRFLVEHNLIDCIVTSAGGVEEDLIKCLAPTFLGDFSLPGHQLRQKGHNRIGNLLVPNDNYCKFEDWLMPILDECLKAQRADMHRNLTPSKFIHLLGRKINDKSSICYWASVNNIPIFCPALTDGSLGDMLYMHSMRNDGGLRLDIVEDLQHLNNMAVRSIQTGVIILGGGLVKHHINNANLMRNGSDYAVFINTSQEFDGSDSGAKPDEAISWGKIKPNAPKVKLTADATIVFPLLVAQTFARDIFSE